MHCNLTATAHHHVITCTCCISAAIWHQRPPLSSCSTSTTCSAQFSNGIPSFSVSSSFSSSNLCVLGFGSDVRLSISVSVQQRRSATRAASAAENIFIHIVFRINLSITDDEGSTRSTATQRRMMQQHLSTSYYMSSGKTRERRHRPHLLSFSYQRYLCFSNNVGSSSSHIDHQP